MIATNPPKKKARKSGAFYQCNLHLRLQGDSLDQFCRSVKLNLQPVRMIFFPCQLGCTKQDVAGLIILMLFAQSNTFAQRGAHVIFQREIEA